MQILIHVNKASLKGMQNAPEMVHAHKLLFQMMWNVVVIKVVMVPSSKVTTSALERVHAFVRMLKLMVDVKEMAVKTSKARVRVVD